MTASAFHFFLDGLLGFGADVDVVGAVGVGKPPPLRADILGDDDLGRGADVFGSKWFGTLPFFGFGSWLLSWCLNRSRRLLESGLLARSCRVMPLVLFAPFQFTLGDGIGKVGVCLLGRALGLCYVFEATGLLCVAAGFDCPHPTVPRWQLCKKR